MTATKPRRPVNWRRLTPLLRRRSDVAAMLALVVAGVTLFAVGVNPSAADPTVLVGKPVPAQDVEPLTAAALSCPTLNPPRLAAQIMAASGFDQGAGGDGRSGLGGLDDATWDRWRPAPTALRTDRGANVLALARYTCDLVGTLRAAGVSGDLWQAAVGADRAGVPAVIQARGVPEPAQAYVDRVVRYANWYAKQEVFRAGGLSASPSAAGQGAIAVPEEYVESVRAAGRLCPTVTPARIAAQLMASSGFDPNMRAADGGAGIAQFSADMWDLYRPARRATPWQPAEAIPALGAAMCDLVSQLTGLSGNDPYVLALGAFQWGLDAVRQANGLPRVNVAQLALIAPAYVPVYEQDVRLRTAPSTTESSVPPSLVPSISAFPPPSPAPVPSTSASPSPTATPSYELNVSYQIVNDWTKAVTDLAGAGPTTEAGVRIEFRPNQKAEDQYWKLSAADDNTHVLILNAYSGKALGVRDSSKLASAEVVQLDAAPSDRNQQWKLTAAGDGTVYIVNRNSGMVLDAPGVQAGPKPASEWSGVGIRQMPLRSGERDQRWVLAR